MKIAPEYIVHDVLAMPGPIPATVCLISGVFDQLLMIFNILLLLSLLLLLLMHLLIYRYYYICRKC